MTPEEKRRLLVQARDDAHRSMDMLGFGVLGSLLFWASLFLWLLR